MEIRVVVPQEAHAISLAERLAAVGDATAVVGEDCEVLVKTQPQARQALSQVLSAVEQWLEVSAVNAGAAVDAATVWLNGTSYTIGRRRTADSRGASRVRGS
jgi:hypothetical protein